MSKEIIDTLTKQLDEANKKLDEYVKYASLTEAEKSHYAKLNIVAQSQFIAKSADERAREVAPVYTDLRGNVYTKADDLRYVDAAKRADEFEKLAKEAAAKERTSRYAKQASTELATLTGTDEDKALLLAAVDAVSDSPATTARLHAMLKGAAAVASGVFTEVVAKNTEDTVDADGDISKSDAAAELDKLAKSIQKQNPSWTFEKAYAHGMRTQIGQKLYSKTI